MKSMLQIFLFATAIFCASVEGLCQYKSKKRFSNNLYHSDLTTNSENKRESGEIIDKLDSMSTSLSYFDGTSVVIKSYFYYSNEGTLLYSINKTFNDIGELLESDSSTFTYLNGKFQLGYYYVKDVSNIYRLDSKLTYKYNAAGLLISTEEANIDPSDNVSWIDITFTLYEYNGFNKVKSSVESTKKTEEAEGAIRSRENFFYNSFQKTDSIVKLTLDSVTNTLKFDQRQVFYYDSTKRDTTIIFSDWQQSTGWTPTLKWINNYSKDGSVASYFLYDWEELGNKWRLEFKGLYEYSPTFQYVNMKYPLDMFENFYIKLGQGPAITNVKGLWWSESKQNFELRSESQLSYSRILFVAVNNPTIFSFSIYPNPASTSVTIETLSLDDSKKTATISNLIGDSMLESDWTMQTISFPLESLPPGTYFLQISENGKTHREKILVK